jgi:two-component system response regulator ResD
MKALKVLVADDDPNVCEIIRLYFQEHHLEVIEASNGLDAVRLAEEEEPDIIILDVMMPGMDGYDVTRTLRAKTDVPIIMLTAKGSELDRVLGLELGADDYVTKPFSPRELVARIKAILRRINRENNASSPEESGPHQDKTVYTYGPLKVDKQRREVRVDGQLVELRPKEFDLLAYMVSHAGQVLNREQLLEQVWGYDFYGDTRTVDAHVKKLRQKLGQHDLECIHTVWGVGYRFELYDDDQTDVSDDAGQQQAKPLNRKSAGEGNADE